MAYAVGSAIAPVLGGMLTDVYGFRETSDIIGIFAILCAFLNFGIVFVPNIICGGAKIDDKESTRDQSSDQLTFSDQITFSPVLEQFSALTETKIDAR